MSNGNGSKFDIDLRAGEAREDAFVHVLLQAKVEHKRDRKCWQTGNVCIEYSQHGKPSGIAVSEADWYAIEYRHQHWLFLPMEKVRDLARKAYREGRHRDTGDNGNHSALVPLEWFFDKKLDGPLGFETGAEGFAHDEQARQAA